MLKVNKSRGTMVRKTFQLSWDWDAFGFHVKLTLGLEIFDHPCFILFRNLLFNYVGTWC